MFYSARYIIVETRATFYDIFNSLLIDYVATVSRRVSCLFLSLNIRICSHFNRSVLEIFSKHFTGNSFIYVMQREYMFL